MIEKNQSPAQPDDDPSRVDDKNAEGDTEVSTINQKITRKLEGGRPHKVYDYMFVQMSHETFQKEYAQKRVAVVQTEMPGDS